MWNLKKTKLIKLENRLLVTIGWKVGKKWENTSHRVQISNYNINKFLESNDNDR